MTQLFRRLKLGLLGVLQHTPPTTKLKTPTWASLTRSSSNQFPWITKQALASTTLRQLSSPWLQPIFSSQRCSNKVLGPCRTFSSLSQSLCLGLELQPHSLLKQRHFKHSLKRNLVVSNRSRISLELNNRSLISVKLSLQRSSSQLALSNSRLKFLISLHSQISVRRLSLENLLCQRSVLHSLVRLLRHSSPNKPSQSL